MPGYCPKFHHMGFSENNREATEHKFPEVLLVNMQTDFIFLEKIKRELSAKLLLDSTRFPKVGFTLCERLLKT